MNKKIQLKIKQLFLIDGLGALLSSFMLGIVLVKFEANFGIPKSILYQLAFWPILFAIFDFYFFVFAKRNLSNLLRFIAILNICYCIYSLIMAIFHMASITYLGWTYIVLEIVVVLTLVIIELTVANRHSD